MQFVLYHLRVFHLYVGKSSKDAPITEQKRGNKKSTVNGLFMRVTSDVAMIRTVSVHARLPLQPKQVRVAK